MDDEFKKGAEDYFKKHHLEFMRKMSTKDWKAYYAKKIHGPVKIYYFFLNKHLTNSKPLNQSLLLVLENPQTK